MILMGQQVPKDFVDANTVTAETRFKLIEEEYKEWQAAPPLDNELLDSLIDILYVTYGTIAALGVTYLHIPYKSIPLTQKKIAIDHYVARVLASLRQRPLCRDSLQPSLGELISACYQAGQANGLDMLAAFDIVHKANLTKLWTREEVKSMGISPDLTSHRPTVDKFVVFNAYGKVVKPPSFQPPNLQPITIAALRLFETSTSSAAPAVASVPPAASAASHAAKPPVPPPRPATGLQSHSKKAAPTFRPKVS